MKTTKNLLIYIGLPLVVLSLFIWQLDNLETFFKQYPNAINGATLVFLLITTTLSIIIAYKSYRNSIEQEIRQQQKKSKLLKISINRKTQKLRMRIKLVNSEYAVRHEVEDFDLLYEIMKERNTKKDILEFKDILDKVVLENPTNFTEEDMNLIINRSMKLENLAFMVIGYMGSRGDELDNIPQELLGGRTVKEYIHHNIVAVTDKI